MGNLNQKNEMNKENKSLGQIAFEQFCRRHKVKSPWACSTEFNQACWESVACVVVTEQRSRWTKGLKQVMPWLKLHPIGQTALEGYMKKGGSDWRWDQVTKENKEKWNAAGQAVLSHFVKMCRKGDLLLNRKDKTKTKTTKAK